MKIDKYKQLKIFHFAKYIQKKYEMANLNVLIFGNFGAQNFGDEAILAGEIQELKKISNISITVVSKNPDQIKKIHNISSIYLYNPLILLKKLIKTNLVIVGGGGIICKSDRGLIGILYQFYTLFMYLLLPKMLCKKICALGLGVYDNSNPLILKISLILLRSIEEVTLRDFHSYELLNKYNISSKLYKDNSFLMDLQTRDKILKSDFFKKKYNKKFYNVGLALMRPENNTEKNYIVAELVRLINNNPTNTHYWFYACDYQIGFDNDLLFAQEIIKEINKTSEFKVRYSIIPTSLSPQMFFSSFILMDYIISMRLHASIFAYRNNVNFMGLTYDRKCTSFLDSIGKVPIDLKFTKDKTNLLFNTI
ncbi:MAG TPA: polysaccharide pyruvyl transferase family protein [Candidatus Limnocylindrales bacterium]|nr:polysaccharide pyruvyl transferase family protein [Candidatus Limnocylindrales bacterium]